MPRYVTQRGVTVETSAANAAAMGYRPASGQREQQPSTPPQKKAKGRREVAPKPEDE